MYLNKKKISVMQDTSNFITRSYIVAFRLLSSNSWESEAGNDIREHFQNIEETV